MLFCQNCKVTLLVALNMSDPEGGGLVRVKYSAVWKGSVVDYLREHRNIQDVYYKTTAELAAALQLTESCGAAPVVEDGKVAGNVAARIVSDDVDVLVVSRSGRQALQSFSAHDQFCIVTGFNAARWSVDYYGRDASTLPTSDVPLHHAVLHAADEFNWDSTPYASLHGHALETSEQAQRLGLPCSVKETLFSTSDDMYELLSLVKQHPFPLHRVYVRKGHGFVVLGTTVAEAVEIFNANVKPFIA